MMEKMITCGTKTINRDINGPPKVEEKRRSAPGPIWRKKGMYSIKVINKTPPTIESATLHSVWKNPLGPFIEVYLVLFLAKIAELFRT